MRARRLPVFSWTSFLRISLVALGSFGVAGANGDACTIRIVIDSETHDHDEEEPAEGEGEGGPIVADSDFDGLDDESERAFGTDPNNPDTDFDGLLDGSEACVAIAVGGPIASSDGAFAPPPAPSFCTDPLNADSDFDGLSDADEIYATGTDPLNPDSDFDGIPDGLDDNSNIVIVQDTDGDGLDDEFERAIGTDPYNADSDFDGLLDGQESCAQPVPPPTPCPDLGRPVFLPQCDPGYVAVPVDECGYEWTCVQDAAACPAVWVEPPTCAEGEVAVALDECALEWACVVDDGTVAATSGDQQMLPQTEPDGATPGDAQQDPLNDDDSGLVGGSAGDSQQDPMQDAPVATPLPWSCTDPLNADSDFDGLSDAEELYRTGTDPLNPDTDGDGILDGADR